MKNSEYVDEFLIYEKKIKALSPNTLKAYSSDLDILSEFTLYRGIDFPSFSTEDAREFMRSLEKEGRAEKSRQRILTSCHTFFTYLEKNSDTNTVRLSDRKTKSNLTVKTKYRSLGQWAGSRSRTESRMAQEIRLSK